MGSTPPGIAADAARKALLGNEAAEASHNDADAGQAALDEAELQALEHAEYYPDEAPARVKRSVLDRLLGRGAR